ncbi:hypothetical protein N338_06105, partial [Podiceps cristatus]
KDLMLDDSFQDLELYPEFIQPSLLNVLQCKVQQSVLPGTQEGMGWNQPALLIIVSLVHTCIQAGESSKGCHRGIARGWGEGQVCFLQSFNSVSAAVKINTAPGSHCLFQPCSVENYFTSFSSLIC